MQSILTPDISEESDVPLDENTTYALVMARLPGVLELDTILDSDQFTVEEKRACILDVLNMMEHIQDGYELVYTSNQWKIHIRGYEKKLMLEKSFLLQETDKPSKPTVENWLQTQGHMQYEATKSLIEECLGMQEKLLVHSAFRNILTSRFFLHRIRQGHGDVKGGNVFFATISGYKHPVPVFIDAIDKPEFADSDILAESAMFIVYAFEKTGSEQLLDELIRGLYMSEKGCISGVGDYQILLYFHLVEKAMALITVNVLFDEKYKEANRYINVLAKLRDRFKAVYTSFLDEN